MAFKVPVPVISLYGIIIKERNKNWTFHKRIAATIIIPFGNRIPVGAIHPWW